MKNKLYVINSFKLKMRISSLIFIIMFVLVYSQQYNVQLIFEEQYHNLIHKKDYYNLDDFNEIFCENNIICKKILIIMYYWCCIYFTMIIIRTIIILCVLIMCIIND